MSKLLKPFFILLSLLIVFPFFADAEYEDYIPLSVPFTLEGKTFSNFVCNTVYQSSIDNHHTDCFYISDDTDFFLYYDIGDYISLKILASSSSYSSYISCTADNGVNHPTNCSYVLSYDSEMTPIARGPIYESFFHTMPIYDSTGTTIITDPNIGNVSPSSNSFDFPLNDSYVPTGETNFSGKCKNIGENYGLFTTELSDVNDSYNPNIICQSDYTWSAVRDTFSGGNEWFLYDFIDNNWVGVYYRGYSPDSLLWSLFFQYPQLDSQNTAKVSISSSFPFRVRYTIENANFEDVEIHLDKCTDSTFSNCSTEILNNTLPYFDEDKTGYFEFSLSTVAGYEYYDFYMVYDSLVPYSLKFRVFGSTDIDSQIAVLPDKKDLGYWGNTIRDFVMPPYGYFEVKINNLKNVFFDKFSFINQIRTSINSRASTPSDSVFTSPVITFLGDDYAVIGAGTLDAFLPIMRNIISGLIYFLLSIFVIRSVSKIINT